MKKIVFFVFILSIVLLSFKSRESVQARNITKVEVETLVEDSLLSIRALEVIDCKLSDETECKYGIFATSNGEFGVISKDHLGRDYALIVHEYKFDSIIPNFRAIENTSRKWYENSFLLAIGSPVLLYKNDTLVYQENHPQAFYDSMDFWNEEEGIAIGDSTDGCLSVIITRDGGNTWNKLTCDQLPKGLEKEGAFAASDTNIAIVGDNTWVATTAGRVYYSPDKGYTWEVFDTPIIKEEETQGIYSIDFYDELHGFAIGGDYTKPDDNTANKIITKDGGKTWQLVAQNQNPGYRSCVQYMPGRESKELVAIGFKGIDYSNDGGHNWKHLSDEGFYTIRFLNDSTAYAAGQGRISKLTFR